MTNVGGLTANLSTWDENSFLLRTPVHHAHLSQYTTLTLSGSIMEGQVEKQEPSFLGRKYEIGLDFPVRSSQHDMLMQNIT